MTDPALWLGDAFEQALNSQDIQAWVKDLDGVFVWTNRLTGGSGDARLVGTRDVDVQSVHNADAVEELRDHDRQVLESGQRLTFIERLRTHDGVMHVFRTSRYPVYDKTGQVCGIGAIAVDVTELLAVQEELEAQSVLLSGVLEAIADGVVAVDETGAVIRENAAAPVVLRTSQLKTDDPDSWQDYYGAFTPDGSAPFPTGDYPLVRAMAGQSTDNVQILMRRPDGEQFLVELSGRPLQLPDGRVGAVAVFRDVTERERLAEQARSVNRQLADALDRWQTLVDTMNMVNEVGRKFPGDQRPQLTLTRIEPPTP